MGQDLRVALRTLARTPLFTAMAGALLALGVGAAVAVFSVIDGVLLKALPYPEPDRNVTLWEATERSRTIGVSAPNFDDWQRSATSFSALAAWSGGRGTVVGGREPATTGVYAVTRDFFAALGVAPAIGRTFSMDEARENEDLLPLDDGERVGPAAEEVGEGAAEEGVGLVLERVDLLAGVQDPLRVLHVAQAVHRLLHLVRQDVQQHLRIRARVHVPEVLPEQFFLQALGVGQVAVVAEDDAEGGIDVEGLGLAELEAEPAVG